MKIKLDNKDKLALAGVAVIAYTVWIVPTIIAGWLAYAYKEKLAKLYLQANKESTIDKLKNLFK